MCVLRVYETMPSKSRDTVRRNFSITQEASQAINSFADEHNLTKSKVVERAVLEYTGGNTTGRIEQKVDRILAAVEDGDVPLAQTGGKKKNSQSDSTDFDPTGYDPDEERDEPLSKAELKELIALDEPVVNPEHLDVNDLPGSKRERTTLMAAVVRYNTIDADFETLREGHVRVAIRENLGDSDYLLEQYTDPVSRKFDRKLELEFNRDKGKYAAGMTQYFPTENHRREYYQWQYETIQEAVNTPVDEMPWFGEYKQPYEFLRQWLDNYTVRNTLQELDIATSEEMDDLQEELLAYRDDVDQCLTAIEETTDRYSRDFSREEAIEAVPYDKEQSESMVSLLDEMGYIGDWDSPGKDMGIDERRIVWRD